MRKGTTRGTWSRLLSKPSQFDNSQEEDIKNFREWSWQVTPYLGAIDFGYAKELEDLANDPTKPMDLSTANAATMDRSHKLYGLLVGLLRGRALQTLKSVAGAAVAMVVPPR
eukprot:s119_g30.t1